MNQKNNFKFIALILISLLCFSACSVTSNNTEYQSIENWAYCDTDIQEDVDLFIICPTVDLGTDTRFNMSLDDAETKSAFVGALNMQLGIYDEECNVFSPYYRQMTLSGYELDDYDAYIDIAYEDVKASFLYYFENYNEGRPFVLAGFSQGSQLALMLMQDLFEDSQYSERLVAAYLIGWSVTEDDIEGKSWMQMATGEDDTGCIISFNSEAIEIDSSFIVPEGTVSLSINPLNWETDATVATASENIGACFTDYSGEIVLEMEHFSGAYLDSTRGTLKVTDIDSQDYPPVLDLFAQGEYHLYDYQFFYRNLQENVAVRIDSYFAQ